MDRITVTPSPASTYCSLYGGSQHSPLRRSQRLIDKENRDLPKIPHKSISPQLFGNTEDDYSELLLNKEKVVHLKPAAKLVHLKSVDNVDERRSPAKILQSKPNNKIVHLKPSDNIIQLKILDDAKKPGKNKCNIRKGDPPRNSQRSSAQCTPKKRGRKLKQPAKEEAKKLKSSIPNDHLGNTPSPSKLPAKYPAHFVHQLPPAKDSYRAVRSRSSSAPAFELADLCLTPDEIPTPEGHGKILNKSPSDLDSDVSMNISLSDSIGEIFGTKDISSILTMQRPRQYILLEEHLPTLATMLNVDLERLRSVLEITQGLTHEQILRFPIKQEVDELEVSEK
ncbi:meiotic recombination protein P22 [Drosophila teissieri]|uniref:meiotic recombination protein P22 n=1 Tax=Drosophila teissieri TaxID=7243 RepID=UPI001CBA1969|nr:meiotic recombination protein P22 [Drosophila teissieri]